MGPVSCRETWGQDAVSTRFSTSPSKAELSVSYGPVTPLPSDILTDARWSAQHEPHTGTLVAELLMVGEEDVIPVPH